MAKHHKELIAFLQNNNFKADCSQCGNVFRLKDAVFFPIDEFTSEAKEKMIEIKEALKERKATLQQMTAKKKQKIENTTQSVNMGFMLERLAPVLEEFRFNKNDCRSLFDPIDYIIFDGLHKNGKIQKIFFIDIKSGAAKLKKNQKAIKSKIEEKKVDFKIY
jgi:predicted Holliday junction resolvase-like endonuclease